MKKAVQITKTKTKVKNKTTGEKTKESSTVKTFIVQDDYLKINTWREKELLDLTLKYEIQMALNNSAVKDLMLREAESLLGIDMAVQNKNAMLAAYDAALHQRDNLLYLWQQNQAFTDNYWQKKLPVHRLIQSSLILNLSRKFNELRHMCYLATKALEYKYMEKMEGLSIGVGRQINISDIFKLQTTIDFDDYLGNLNDYNVIMAGSPGIQSHSYLISLSNELNITAQNETDRYKIFQEFVNSHLDAQGNLVFTFTTAVNQQVFKEFSRANIKIWDSITPPYSSLGAEGVTASLLFNGATGAIIPKLKITQKGTHTFYRKDGKELANYYPINLLALVTAKDSLTEPSTQIEFTPFININPRYDDTTGQKGVWTSAFTNRSVAATIWEVTLYKQSASGINVVDVPINKLSDIYFIFDTVGYPVQ